MSSAQSIFRRTSASKPTETSLRRRPYGESSNSSNKNGRQIIVVVKATSIMVGQINENDTIDHNDHNHEQKQKQQQQQQHQNSVQKLTVNKEKNATQKIKCYETTATVTNEKKTRPSYVSCDTNDDSVETDDLSVSSTSSTPLPVQQVQEQDKELSVKDIIQFSEPDVYGQIHPIETEELIALARIEFEIELSKLPKELTYNAYLAAQKGPDVVTDEFKLMFLRADVYKTYAAAKRYAKYWNSRLELFGIDRAFLPLTIANLTPSEVELLQNSNVLHIIPSTCPVDPRYKAFIEPGNVKSKSTLYTDDFIRVLWYMCHLLLSIDIETQKKGVIGMGNSKNARLWMMDREFAARLVYFGKDCIPQRVSGYHFLNPPPSFRVAKPLADLFLGRRLAKRLVSHFYNADQNDHNLHKYNILRHDLPTVVGGNYQLDNYKWVQQLKAAGK